MDIAVARGAHKIIEQCLAVRPGEKVLIVTDTDTDPLIARSLAVAAEAAGADSMVTVIKPFRTAGEEPPAPVAVAMAEADVVIAATSRSMFHTAAARRATERGRARFYALSEVTPDMLMRGMIEADFVKQKPLVDTLAEKMTKGKEIRIRAPGGTDLTASIEGRAAIPESGLCHVRGERMGASIEVYIAPQEDSTAGWFVCDASCSMIGLVGEPMRMEVRGGKVVDIRGGESARRLRDILESVNDPAAYTVAEIAFGLNPKARITGRIIEDEGKYGTGHVALGNNTGFGGKNKAPIHIDMVYWKPDVWIDSEQVFAGGVLVTR